ncbi:MAG: hypothetical protein PVF65_06005 [Sphingomonadales bacterium]|jgi:hypothetical protein
MTQDFRNFLIDESTALEKPSQFAAGKSAPAALPPEGEGVSFEQFLIPEETAPGAFRGGKERGYGKDVAKQLAIGAATGVGGTYGDLAQLAGLSGPRLLPGQEALYGAEFEATSPGQLALLQEDDIAPRFGRLPTGGDITDLLEMFGVQSEPKTTPGKYARRGADIVGGGAVTGAGPKMLGALAGASALGQSVEEVFGPEAGAAAELMSLFLPQAFAKKLIFSGKNSQLSKSLINAGVPKNVVANLLKPFAKTAAKLAPTGKKAKSLAQELKGGIEKGYEATRLKGRAKGPISLLQSWSLNKEIGSVKKGLGITLKGSDKSRVKDALTDLQNIVAGREVDPADIMDLWHEVNSLVNWNAMKGGKKQLAKLHPIFERVIRHADPHLANEWLALQEVYPKMKKIVNSLDPKKESKLRELGPGAATVWHLFSGHAKRALKLLAGYGVAQEGALHYLRSPRTQKLFRKMVDLTNRGKIDQARVIANHIDAGIRAQKKNEEEKKGVGH